MTIAGALIYFGSFAASGWVLFIAVLGVMWAPFGAVICGGSAKIKQLPVLRFAIAGALSSLFMLLPWFYLITRMAGKPFPRPLAVLSYIAVYSSWLYGPLLTYFWSYVIITESPELSDYFAAGGSSYLILSIYMIAVGVAMWTVSLIMLLIAHHRWPEDDDESAGILPKHEYVMPSALLFCYTMLIIPTMYNLWWLVVPVSLSALAWLIYPLFKWLYVIIRGRFARQLTDA